MIHDSRINFGFWGTDSFAVSVLNELKSAGFLPTLIVTAPDRPKGRKLILTPPPAKIWAIENKIDFLQPEKLNLDFCSTLHTTHCTLFVVASYGKIIPKSILEIPENGTLNIHPSLLPKYRGSSPVQTAILNGDKKTGVTVMLMDEKMDHGPILAQQEYRIVIQDSGSMNIPNAEELEKTLAEIGGRLLAEVLPKWINKEIKEKEQNHSEATFTNLIKKEDGLLDIINGNPKENFLKIKAYKGWPTAYFFTETNTDKQQKKIRVIVKEAKFEDDKLIITKVLPESGKEMDYEDFLKTIKK